MDLTGLVITSIAEGDISDLSLLEISPSNTTVLEEVGIQEVQINYNGKKTSLRITVLPVIFNICKQPRSIEFPIYQEGNELKTSTISYGTGTLFFKWYVKNAGEPEYKLVKEEEPITAEIGRTYSSSLKIKSNFIESDYHCVVSIISDDITYDQKTDTAHVTQTIDTGLPLLIIQTENSVGITSKEDYVQASMSLLEDGQIYSDGLKIKGRGNATWSYEKKPYKIKLDSKASLLEMNSDKNWVLLANYCDKTLMRTSLGFQTSSLLGIEYTPDYRFVDLVINGEYLGNYQLTEAVKEGKKRVNISDEGFLIEASQYDDEPVRIITDTCKAIIHFKFPDSDEITNSQIDYVSNQMNSFEQLLYSSNDIAFDPIEGYCKLINVDSWARWFLVQNILQNKDMNKYYYKYDNSADSKIFMGPVWDFEWSIGIGWDYSTRPSQNHSLIVPLYFDRLLQDPLFVTKVKDIWNGMKDTILSDLLDFYDDTIMVIDASQELNFKRWDILDKQVSVGGSPLGSFEKEVECDKKFLEGHISWLDNEINNL